MTIANLNNQYFHLYLDQISQKYAKFDSFSITIEPIHLKNLKNKYNYYCFYPS